MNKPPEKTHWVGGWIRAARTHAGKNQEQLGEEMSLTKGNISAWENHRHSPSIEQLAKVAEITGYPLPDTISKLMAAEPLRSVAEAAGLSQQAMMVAKAFDRLESSSQRVAVMAQLKAFGAL